MNSEKFFKIINKHFQKEDIKNFHGILITPVFDGELTVFGFDNPNNVSFNNSCIRNYFFDECDMFGKIFDFEGREMYTKYIKHDSKSFSSGNQIFLNDSDRQTLTNITKKHSKKLIINSSRYDVSLSADISVVGDVHLSSYDSESIGLEIELKFENLTNPKKPSYNLNRNISALKGWLYDDYHNYDEIVSDLFRLSHDFIMDNPLLFDNSYMYINTNITPIVYNEEGEMVDF
jgi:hypothetical protein